MISRLLNPSGLSQPIPDKNQNLFTMKRLLFTMKRTMGLMGHLTLGWNQNLHTESDFLRCADLAVNLKMVVPKFCSDVVLPTLKD